MPRSSREKQMAIFASRFTYDTQRIEGSKLTLKETANLLEKGITPKDKPLEDVKEAEAHKRLFYAEVLISKKRICPSISLLNGIGSYFKRPSQILQARLESIKHVSQVVNSSLHSLLKFIRFFENSSNGMIGIRVRMNLHHPVELAAFVHLKFVTIHPFGDGNGRISRLMMNFVLNKEGYPMLDISL